MHRFIGFISAKPCDGALTINVLLAGLRSETAYVANTVLVSGVGALPRRGSAVLFHEAVAGSPRLGRYATTAGAAQWLGRMAGTGTLACGRGSFIGMAYVSASIPWQGTGSSHS